MSTSANKRSRAKRATGATAGASSLNRVCSAWAMSLVLHDGKPQVAYPRKIQSEVYASGYSGKGKLEIIEGIFTPNDQTQPRAEKE